MILCGHAHQHVIGVILPRIHRDVFRVCLLPVLLWPEVPAVALGDVSISQDLDRDVFQPGEGASGEDVLHADRYRNGAVIDPSGRRCRIDLDLRRCRARTVRDHSAFRVDIGDVPRTVHDPCVYHSLAVRHDGKVPAPFLPLGFSEHFQRKAFKHAPFERTGHVPVVGYRRHPGCRVFRPVCDRDGAAVHEPETHASREACKRAVPVTTRHDDAACRRSSVHRKIVFLIYCCVPCKVCYADAQAIIGIRAEAVHRKAVSIVIPGPALLRKCRYGSPAVCTYVPAVRVLLGDSCLHALFCEVPFLHRDRGGHRFLRKIGG